MPPIADLGQCLVKALKGQKPNDAWRREVSYSFANYQKGGSKNIRNIANATACALGDADAREWMERWAAYELGDSQPEWGRIYFGHSELLSRMKESWRYAAALSAARIESVRRWLTVMDTLLALTSVPWPATPFMEGKRGQILWTGPYLAHAGTRSPEGTWGMCGTERLLSASLRIPATSRRPQEWVGDVADAAGVNHLSRDDRARLREYVLATTSEAREQQLDGLLQMLGRERRFATRIEYHILGTEGGLATWINRADNPHSAPAYAITYTFATRIAAVLAPRTELDRGFAPGSCEREGDRLRMSWSATLNGRSDSGSDELALPPGADVYHVVLSADGAGRIA